MEAFNSTRKELKHKIKKLEERIKKLEFKQSVELEKHKSQGKSLRYARKRIIVLQKSRDSWKEKLKSKRLETKNLEHKINRQGKVKRHHYSYKIIHLCFLLRQQGKSSYLGICRILQVLCFCGLLELEQLPCANTIQKWVSKMGLYTLKNSHNVLRNKEVCLIVDESIKIGEERLLPILACDAAKSVLRSKKQGKGKENEGLCFENLGICHIEGRKTWNGDEIEKILNKLVKKVGFKVTYVLSDEDSKLKKAVRQFGGIHVPDISHGVANCLKKTFDKQEIYKDFTKTISNFQCKGVNQDLTYLIPPKQRTKARFMNQKPIVEWAINLLDRFELLNDKEKLFFKDLLAFKPFVELLSMLINCTEQIALILKNKGLCNQTLQEVEKLMTILTAVKLKEYQDFKSTYIGHLQTYMEQYKTILEQVKELGLYNINVCSDVIESLFGKYKTIAPSNPLVSMINTALELPIYCMTPTEVEENLEQALISNFMSDLKEWKNEHSIENQAVRRSVFFRKRA